MEYRVIVLKNNEYLKTLYKCRKEKNGYKKFNDLTFNNNVFFPKKFVNCFGIQPVNYHICLVKEYEKTDDKKYIKDEYGRNVYLGKIQNKWSLLKSEDYLVEEQFYIYTTNHEKIKTSIKEIIRILARHAYKKSAMKQVLLIYNKILIYDEENTDVIVCKCVEDAERLHYDLYRNTKKLKVKSLIFNGNPTKDIISMAYQKIMEHTKWPHHKVRKKTSYK